MPRENQYPMIKLLAVCNERPALVASEVYPAN
ncbi:hypothetical protein J2T02_000216 [Chitinophaga terrae (ex Kim and Jung 2007)]|nr:hypothetical protein [Chitinophaga terrae (ex Kim and Jung 2007)]